MKRKSELIIAAAVLCALVGTGSLWVFSEKDIPHSTNEDWITAHYRGLGWEDDSTGLMGYMWTGVTMRFNDGGYYRAEFKRPGFNPFVGYYPDGSIREFGTCMVEMVNSGPVMPSPDFHNVDSSQCYKPDGTLGSEVINGTGIQTVWLPDGTKIWELHLKDHVRTLHRMWYENGQLRSEQAYKDGFVHGPFTSYYEDGQVQTQGEYDLGESVGVWKRYEPDGTVWSEQDYETPDDDTSTSRNQMPPNLWGEVPPLTETFAQIEQFVAKRGGPARIPSPPQDWAAIEARLGTTIPEDFRQFVDWHDPMLWSWFVHSERWKKGPNAEPSGVYDYPDRRDDGCWLRDVAAFKAVTARTSDGNAAFGSLVDSIDDSYDWDHEVLDAEFLHFADTLASSCIYLIALDDRFAPRGSVVATELDNPALLVVARNTSEWLAKLVALEGRDIARGGMGELNTEASRRLIEDFKVLNPDQGWY